MIGKEPVMDNLAAFWNTILTQRTWSWAVVGMAYVLIVVLVKGFFFRSLLRRARALHSKWYQEIKKVYVRKSVAGWVLFFLGFLLAIFFWQSADVQRPALYELAMVALIALTVLLSIITHLIAFGIATIYVLKQLENNQMTF